MNAVAFDNTMLSILLNPNGGVPPDPVSGADIELAKERAEYLVESLERAKRKIIIPAPALAELLTVIGPSANQYLDLIGRSRIFEIGNFDARCATELALLNRDQFYKNDRNSKAEPYQKIKVDRQILAICRVYGVTELYTDDRSLRNIAKLCEISTVGIAEIPIPEKSRQHTLDLEQHDDIDSPNDQNG